MKAPNTRARSRAPRGTSQARSADPSRRDGLIGFCRGLPHATEDIKWGDNLIFSIGGKMFAGFDADGTAPYAFKCSDDEFDRLTTIPGIVPAPYAARFSWVKVERRSALRAAESRALLRAAYDLVRAALPARVRAALDETDPGRRS